MMMLEPAQEEEEEEEEEEEFPQGNINEGITTTIMIKHLCNLYPLKHHCYIVKLGVYRGTHNFPIFALKHSLWVHVRTMRPI